MVFPVFLHLGLANESNLPMNYYVFRMYAVKKEERTWIKLERRRLCIPKGMPVTTFSRGYPLPEISKKKRVRGAGCRNESQPERF